MKRVALRELRAHLGRSLLAVAAVVLGISFVTGTFSLRAMLAGTVSNLTSSIQSADVYVRGAEVEDPAAAEPGADSADPMAQDGQGQGSALMNFANARAPVDLTVADTLRDIDGVEHAAAELAGVLVLVGADGLAVVNGNAPGIGSAWDEGARSTRITAGRAPAGPGEIAIETVALERSGLAVGDTTTIVAGGTEPQQVTVVGEASYDAALIGATLVLLDPASALEAYAPAGTVDQVAVYGPADASEDELAALVDDVRAAVADDPDLEVVSGDDVREEATAATEEAVGFLGTFLLIFAIIALFVGAFIIFNTFAMQVRQRQRDFALLRAVGASPGQVLASLLTQAAVIGLAGSALGVGLGIALVAVIGRLLTSFGLEFSTQVAPTAAQVAGTLVLGTLTSVIAAAVPAWRGARTAPVEAMRDATAPPESSLALGTVLGGLLVGGGLFSLWRAIATESGWFLAAAAAGLLVGTLVLSPAIARITLPLLAAPAVAALRPMGRLARGNVIRHD